MRFFRFLAVLLILLMAGAGGLWWAWGRDLPSVTDLDVLEISGQTRVYDRAGTLVGTLTPSLSSGNGVNRNLLKLSGISPTLQKAVVTSEDRRFFEHHGVDYIGIVRGLLKGILQNDLEGGSSITQQVVKNTLLADLHSARTPERKFKEALLAYQLDRSYDKNKILNAYLNVVYWGDAGRSDIVGAGTAAHAYFKKEASQLNLAESVYLATIIPAPNRRYKDFAAYRPLMKDLLSRMVEDGRVTQAQADAAWKTPIYPAGWRIGWNDDGTLRSATLENPDRRQQNINTFGAAQQSAQTYQYQHYLQAVEKELLPLVGRKNLYSGGKIYTAMNVQAQQAAEKASLDAQNLPGGATLGIALVSPVNGEVLALVGQKLTGGRPSDWNNATQARRQVGSSIKPLLYTLALSKGFKQSDTLLDAPIQGTEYQPQNYDGHWTGRYVTMRYALDHSLNLPTVRIAQELDVRSFADKLRQMDFTVPDDLGLSLSIGTLEASPLQMAAAYAAFANGGLYYAPTLVRQMEDDRGKVIYKRPAPQASRIWDTQTAWLGLDMIRGVVNDLEAPQGGLATRARIDGWDVGGKTGTTNDIKDLWFVGVTPTVSGAVWVGNQAGGAMPYWALSGTIPTPIWQQAVAGTLQGQPKASFQEPDGIAYRVVRRVKMAFLNSNADQDSVQHDGTPRSGGLFGNRSNPAPETQADPQATTAPAPDTTQMGNQDTATPATSTDTTSTDTSSGVAPAPDQTATPTPTPPAPTDTQTTPTTPAEIPPADQNAAPPADGVLTPAPPEALPADQGQNSGSDTQNNSGSGTTNNNSGNPEILPPLGQ